ncbi:hypothetical protein F4820DRAFT_269043 [Hypoxylon rubiginosum]|uniref:Uncharacterized protein n=1 Tax=Hypoxylon rubiginosum TaxID=110542 RepID=A0ACB9Z2U3_9PEZI|nr:hypothetical protein F4820DRAFT_269043 [Hypoxylon rubiginosum]
MSFDSLDMNIAWECRDQADQAEIYYNHPLRTKVRRLEDENLTLKRLLRENGINWQSRPKPVQASNGRVTRSSAKAKCKPLPHVPVEVQLRILSFALTSSRPIVDPLCRVKPEHLLVREKAKNPQLAIHFLTTCKAYYVEGNKVLWTNNSFVFTTPETLRNFAEIDLKFRRNIKEVNFRIIARFYDDEERIHKINRHHHPDLKKPIPLNVHKRPRENALARRGFRAYGWYQLVDFLTALLPPYDPYRASFDGALWNHIPSPKLLPNLEKLRIDFVNFGDDTFNTPPPQLHDLASHQLGCTLNEVVLTGLPSDDSGLRASNELAGLLKDEGLLIDHAPSMVALKNSIRALNCGTAECHYSAKVVRAMRPVVDHHADQHDDVHGHSIPEFPTAPKEEGDPPFSPFHSCRTIWKQVPVKIYEGDERKWMLFDRMSGLPWDEIEDEATMFDFLGDSDGGSDAGEGLVCDNCGEIHPGAIPPMEMMDLYDEL